MHAVVTLWVPFAADELRLPATSHLLVLHILPFGWTLLDFAFNIVHHEIDIPCCTMHEHRCFRCNEEEGKKKYKELFQGRNWAMGIYF